MTQRTRSSTRADPTTAYARDVVAGRVIAGPHVVSACARHLRDLERFKDGSVYAWKPDLAERVFAFFRDVLKLSGGEHEAKPFELIGWQLFVLGSLFGWVTREGFRRFRTAFVETGKGSGKSPLAGGIGLYMLMADGESRAEVYAAAVDKEQAGILFRDAVSMAKMSPAIERRVKLSGGDGREFNIAYLSTGSFFRPISSESQGRGKSGYRPHCVLLDEIHEHPTNAMVEFMRAGTKGRRQALIFMITNSGVDRTSVCYEYHHYGAQVAAGLLEDDSFFSYICAVDEEKEDPFTDTPDRKLKYPRSWAKANPSIGVTFPVRYLQEQVAAARGMPSKESIVRRLNFCQWVDAENPWIDGDLWRACEVDTIEPAGPSFLGLDLASKRDLLALAQVWPMPEYTLARLYFWTPKDTLQERERTDRVPYSIWVEKGFLTAVPGRSIDYGFVAKFVGELLAQGEINGLAFDQWRIEDFQRELDDQGIDSFMWEGPEKPEGSGIRMIRHGQGFTGGASDHTLWMPRSISTTEDAVLNHTLRVERNPVLTWNSASAVLEQDATANKKWTKRKSTGRIDGIVALSMALAAADAFLEAGSVYESRGLRSL